MQTYTTVYENGNCKSVKLFVALVSYHNDTQGMTDL